MERTLSRRVFLALLLLGSPLACSYEEPPKDLLKGITQERFAREFDHIFKVAETKKIGSSGTRENGAVWRSINFHTLTMPGYLYMEKGSRPEGKPPIADETARIAIVEYFPDNKSLELLGADAFKDYVAYWQYQPPVWLNKRGFENIPLTFDERGSFIHKVYTAFLRRDKTP